MAVDGFLELVRSGTTTLKGESLDATYRDWISIRSFTLTTDLKSAKDEDEDEEELDEEPEVGAKGTTAKTTPQPKPTPKPKPVGSGQKPQGAFRLFFQITKDVDSSSPDLFQDYCWKAKAEGEGTKVDRFEAATVVLRKSAGKPKPYLILEFKGVSVVSYGIDSGDGDKLPVETIGFAFKTITLRYRPQTMTGQVSKKAEESAYWSFDEAGGQAKAALSSR